MKSLATLALSSLLIVACGNSKKNANGDTGAGGAAGDAGAALALRKIEPPVTANTPMGLKGPGYEPFMMAPDGGTGTDDGGAGVDGGAGGAGGGGTDGGGMGGATDGGNGGATDGGPDFITPLMVIKDRFFTKGPTFVRGVLKSVDGRMSEFVEMINSGTANNTTHVCVDEALKPFSVTMPIDLGFTQKLSCMSSASGMGMSTGGIEKIAFGHDKSDDVWYIREQGPAGATLSRIDPSDNAEAWIIVADGGTLETQSQSLMHLKSTKATGRLEFTVTGKAIGVGCGVQYQSNAEFIYVAGKIADPPNCAASKADAVCVRARDLSDASLSDCMTAGLDTFTLPALSESTISYKDIYKLAMQPVDGLTDFSMVVRTDDAGAGGVDAPGPDGGSGGPAPDGGAGN